MSSTLRSCLHILISMHCKVQMSMCGNALKSWTTSNTVYLVDCQHLNSVLNKQKRIHLKAEFGFFPTADKLSCDAIVAWYFGGSPFTRCLPLLWFSLFITTASSELTNLSACAFISSGICPAASFEVLQVREFLLTILFFLTSSLFRLCASLRFFHSSLPAASMTAGSELVLMSVPAIFSKYLQILGICGKLLMFISRNTEIFDFSTYDCYIKTCILSFTLALCFNKSIY